MDQSKYEYFKQRANEGTQDLYDTVTDYRRVIVAKVIDVSLFFTGLVLIVMYLFTTHWLPNILFGLFVAGYIVLYTLLKAILRGKTAGHLLMGISFINVRTKQRVTLKEYLSYIRKATTLETRYSHIFKYYLVYDSRYVQNEPMKKYGMILADTKKYKQFYKEYSFNVHEYNRLEKLQNNQ